MTDQFASRTPGLESPAANAAEISPSDTTDLTAGTRALYVGIAGDIRVTMAAGQVVTLLSAGPGVVPLRVRRVHATGTSAAAIVALW